MKRWVEGEDLSAIINNKTNLSKAHTRKISKDRLKMRRLKALNDRYLPPPKASFRELFLAKRGKKKVKKQDLRGRYYLLLIPLLLVVSVLGFHYEYDVLALISLCSTMLLSSTTIWLFYFKPDEVGA